MTGLRAARFVVVTTALSALLLGPMHLEAQGIRSGFWMEGAAGTGTLRNTSAGSPGVTVGFGSAYHFRVGTSLNQRVLVGAELFWLRTGRVTLAPGLTPVKAENVSVAPVVIWYVGQSGFFLKIGAGLTHGVFTAVSGVSTTDPTERTGSGLTFGVGFDIGVGPWFALSANFGTYVMTIGDIEVNGMLADDVIATVYEAGVGITIR